MTAHAPPAAFDARARAIAAHRAGRRAEALGLYADCLARAPEDAGLWTNLGALLRADGRHEHALRAQERAHRLAPDDLGILGNLANASSDLGHGERALALRRVLMARAPHEPAHVAMTGKSLRALGRHAEGAALLEAGLARFPDEAELEVQLALTLLAAGRYAEGFRHYGARWRAGELRPRRIAVPKWDGGPLGGRTLLVLPEQGLGDALCFLRFLPALRSFGPGQVALAAAAPLLRLLEGGEGADRVGTGAPPDGFDVWTDLMDLPLLHFAREDAVPAPARLTVPADSVARARAITAPFRDRFRVGVAWRGSPTYRADAFRSFSHRELHALLDLPGVQLFSLYKGPGIEAFRADGTAAFVVDAGSGDRDLADCAAVMREMDLVVTSDTVTAHLAGSLGVPCWTLLHWDPFWLWGREGERTRWYPSMRLIRQERPRDWAGVLARVGRDLRALAAARA